jgi:O-antigen/teichoic acid export membrane protein
MINLLKNSYFCHRETICNFFWRSLQILGKQGITFLIFILCAKLLSPYDFGIYNYILAIIFTLIMLGDFGISSAASKYVAEYSITDIKKSKFILFSSGILILTLTLLITFFVLFLGPVYLKDRFVYILYLLPLLFVAPMTSLYDGMFRGFKRFKELSVISLAVGAVSISFVYILIKSNGLVGALIAQNIFYFLLLVILAWRYGHFDLKFEKKIAFEVGKYSFLIGLSMLGYFLYTRADIMVLGHYGFIEEIGYYEIINKTFQLIILPTTILATVVAPNTTKNFALKKYAHLKNKIAKECYLLFAFGLAVAFIFYFLFPWAVRMFLPEYDVNLLSSMLAVIIFLVPLRFFSTYLSVGYITPSGKASILTRYLIIFGLLNLLLDFILINVLGFIGVIYATLISQVLFILFKDVSFIIFLRKNDQ